MVLLLIALLGFGIWYANKKGYLPREFSTVLFFTVIVDALMPCVDIFKALLL